MELLWLLVAVLVVLWLVGFLVVHIGGGLIHLLLLVALILVVLRLVRGQRVF
jgi:hypothetical protein